MACVKRKTDTAMQNQEFEMDDLEEITFPDNYIIVDEKSDDIVVEEKSDEIDEEEVDFEDEAVIEEKSDEDEIEDEIEDDIEDELEDTDEEADEEKADDIEDDIEVADEEADEEKAIVKISADGSVAKCAKGLTEGCGYKAGAKVCGKCGAMAVQIKRKPMMEEREMEDASMEMDDSEGEKEVMDDESPMEAMNERDRKRRMAARKRRMESMQVKSEDWDDEAFVCGFEGKMLAGGSAPCAACTGGCAPEGDLPTLLEIEGIAEEMLDGKVLASGYSDAADMFVLNVLRKDGSVAEILFDGFTGECEGWQRLPDELLGEKSAMEPIEIISIEEAIDIAVKSLPGEVVSVDADVFQGFDSYAVEIEGIDGKSYDAFVSLDGEMLGYDVYDAEEAADIDAETAEFALKAAYTDKDRMEMANTGLALPDGSYPIANEEDLKNAIQAYGRAKDKAKAKAHIMKRAEELELEDLIPESWMEDDEMDEDEKGEKAAEDPEFLSSLMEFELLALDTDTEENI